MKRYTSPIAEITAIQSADVITTSPGTETTITDETEGVWDTAGFLD